jgi:glycosyltransferase involved in cell wall biosynthesis
MYIIHLGEAGFPYGNATIQRIRYTFKALQLAGAKTLILNKFSRHKRDDQKRVNRSEGIPYVNLSYSIKKPEGSVPIILNKISGIVNELFFLVRKRKKISAAILYTGSFGALLYYRVLSIVLHFKLVIQYVEFRSAIGQRQKMRYKLNDYLFDNYFYKFCNGAIVISEFLKEHVQAKSATLPIMKIPAITDFSSSPVDSTGMGSSYLMYAGTIDYLEIIYFILDLFEQIKLKGIYDGRLLLAIGGNASGILEAKINNNQFHGDVDFRMNVPHKELLSLYLDADLLIIPLRDSIQDIARFPHKVSEYTAAGRPILSTTVGELGYYFRNGESAILANEYSVESYMESISGIGLARAGMDRIAKAGYQIGLRHFDYKSYSRPLADFVANNKKSRS